MTIVKRWFLSLVVLITAAAVISYLVIVLGLGPAGRKANVNDWLLLAVILATSIGITNVIWTRLNRNVAAIKKQLQSLGSDSQTKSLNHQQHPLPSGIEPELNRSITATRNRFELLQLERENLNRQKRVIESRRQHLETILHAIPEAVIVTDSHQRVVLANHAAEEMFGPSDWQAGTKKIENYIQDKDYLKLLNEAKTSSQPQTAEYSRQGKDSKRLYNAIISPIANGTEDQTKGLLTILHDVTREKEIDRLKTDFVSNVSHELRTPLASIKAYLEMLADGEVTDHKVQQEFYAVIQQETERLSSLVENILSISRIDGAAVKPSYQNMPLANVIRETLEPLRPQAQASRIQLHEDLDPTSLQVPFNKEMIQQAVFNLVSNALKYTPTGGEVTVRLLTEPNNAEVKIEVSDTGVGIRKEHLPRIFEKFYRAPSSKEMAKGAGVGLALVKQIVETVHNGHLSVISSPGEGSTFSFCLPLADSTMEITNV